MIFPYSLPRTSKQRDSGVGIVVRFRIGRLSDLEPSVFRAWAQRLGFRVYSLRCVEGFLGVRIQHWGIQKLGVPSWASLS